MINCPSSTILEIFIAVKNHIFGSLVAIFVLRIAKFMLYNPIAELLLVFKTGNYVLNILDFSISLDWA